MQPAEFPAQRLLDAVRGDKTAVVALLSEQCGHCHHQQGHLTHLDKAGDPKVVVVLVPHFGQAAALLEQHNAAHLAREVRQVTTVPTLLVVGGRGPHVVLNGVHTADQLRKAAGAAEEVTGGGRRRLHRATRRLHHATRRLHHATRRRATRRLHRATRRHASRRRR